MGCVDACSNDDAKQQPSLKPGSSGNPQPLPGELDAESNPSVDAPGNREGMASKQSPQASEPPWTEEDDALPSTLEGQREDILRKLRERMGISEDTVVELRKQFAIYNRTGQGNPPVTTHPMTRAECRAIRAAADTAPASAVCGEKNMVALYNPAKGETDREATVCIDQFEFPNIACEYPMTWVQAHQAQGICRALGKRLCDAHEWEGACYGELRAPEDEYAFTLDRNGMSDLHNFNNTKNGEVRWAYGEKKNHKLCGTTSRKSDRCEASEWKFCGSNTFPAGAFPQCVSSFGVYDQHGNAAEHMSLPVKPEQLGSRGGIGRTEMKGSWFIFAMYEAHADNCRWRAPN